jgi:hypothetical protein
MNSPTLDTPFKSSVFAASDSASDFDPSLSPPHFLTEDRVRRADTKTTEHSIRFDQAHLQTSYSMDKPLTPSLNSSFVDQWSYDAPRQEERRHLGTHEKDTFLQELEDRPRSSFSRRDSKPSSRLSHSDIESGNEWSKLMYRAAVDHKKNEGARQHDNSISGLSSVMSYRSSPSPVPSKPLFVSGEAALQAAAAELTTKSIIVRTS